MIKRKELISINKQIRLAAALLTFTLLTTNAAAESAGFRDETNLVSSSKTAYDGKFTNVAWSTEKAEAIGVPVAYQDSVLLPCGNSIKRLSEANGFELAAIKLPEKASTDCSGAMLGATLVQPTENGICFIDFTDGKITGTLNFGANPSSDVAIIDSLAYVAAKNEQGETMYCVDLSDMSIKWQYAAEDEITSTTKQGDYVIFGTGSSLVTCDYESGAANVIALGEEITSAPFATEYAVFFSMGSNTAKLRLNDDGTMEEDTLTLCETGTGTCAPVEYKGRLYTVSDSGFHILDSLNMEILCTLKDVKSGSDPFITVGTGTRIYTVGAYEERFALYSVFDAGEEYEPTVTALAGLDNFNSGRSTVSANGTMYFRDGYGRLFALARVEYNIVAIVIKLVLLAAIIAGIFFWLRYIAKRRENLYPKY